MSQTPAPIIPKTEKEFEERMKEACFNFNSYSINGNLIHEGFGISRSGGLFTWYYTERGERTNLNYFQSEEAIVAYAYAQIQSDKWANTHCIGFTADKQEANALITKLNELSVPFFQDEIPCYGVHQPVYRTFVMGCAISKVKYLKETYYKEKS